MINHLDVIAEQSHRFVEILKAGPLDARVPGCPDWNLGELGLHMAGVQTWATAIIETGEPPTVEPPATTAEPAEVLDRSYRALTTALSAADPEAACWNFTATAPHVMSFWFRRQANEVAMHRWDAESAISESPTPISPTIAVDVIDEFVHVMLNRVIDREGLDISDLTSDVHLHCTDAEGEWTFEITDGELTVVDEHRKSAVAVRGTASDIALFIHGRVDSDTVEVFGDPAVLEQWSTVLRF